MLQKERDILLCSLTVCSKTNGSQSSIVSPDFWSPDSVICRLALPVVCLLVLYFTLGPPSLVPAHFSPMISPMGQTPPPFLLPPPLLEIEKSDGFSRESGRLVCVFVCAQYVFPPEPHHCWNAFTSPYMFGHQWLNICKLKHLDEDKLNSRKRSFTAISDCFHLIV